MTENYYFKGNSSLTVRFINFETLDEANPYYYSCNDSSPQGIYTKGDTITILCSGLFNDNVLIPEKTGAIFELFTDTTSILEIGIKTPKPNSSTN